VPNKPLTPEPPWTPFSTTRYREPCRIPIIKNKIEELVWMICVPQKKDQKEWMESVFQDLRHSL